jgi:hypothetical protein
MEEEHRDDAESAIELQSPKRTGKQPLPPVKVRRSSLASNASQVEEQLSSRGRIRAPPSLQSPTRSTPRR